MDKALRCTLKSLKGVAGSNPVSGTSHRKVSIRAHRALNGSGMGTVKPYATEGDYMLNLDFSNVPSREPLEEGVYSLRIAKAEETESSTGNPMLKVEFDVMGVEGNRKLWDNFVLIDKCLWKVQELFKALGIDTEQVVTMDPQELIGQEVQAKVIQEDYNGDTVNRIKKILPAA